MATNPFAGWTQYARGYLTQGNNVPQGGNANYAPGGNPYQGWTDFARGYKAAHPQEFASNPYAGIDFTSLAKLIAAQNQTPNPSPFDATYENTVGGINRQTNDTLANLGYEEGQLSPTYGYQTDNSGNVTVDPSNPFSKSALLKKTYGENQARSTNSMAAQGQLYSGALQNQQNQNTLGFEQGTDQLKRAYQNALQSIRARRTAAYTNQSIGTNNARADALQRALANRPTQ